jgi:hypothetical protein
MGKVFVGIVIGVLGMWMLLGVLAAIVRAIQARHPAHFNNAGAREFMAERLASGSFSSPEMSELVVYLREMTLTQYHIKRQARTIEVHLAQGWGFINYEGDMMLFPKPQDTDDEDDENMLGEFVLHGHWPKISDSTFNLYARAISQWLDNGIPLMVCVADGLPATVIEEGDQTHWLPFPLG